MPGGCRRPAPLQQEILDDAVFERVEGDHHEPARRLQHVLGGGETVGKLAEFVVDENPQCLKRAGRRMNCARSRRRSARDEFGERPCRVNNPLLPHPDDGARDGAGMVFLAEDRNDGGEIAFAAVGDDIGCGRTVAPHAHIERPVEPEREAAIGLVELHGRHADVKHDAVDRGAGVLTYDRLQAGETILDQFEPPLRLFDEIGASRDGALVAIDADHPRARRSQNCARKAAGAECGVDVEAAIAHVEPFDGAMDEHGNMTSQSASDSRAAAARHHSRAPSGFGTAAAAIIRVPSSCLKARTFSVASASSVRKRPGSQIRNL